MERLPRGGTAFLWTLFAFWGRQCRALVDQTRATTLAEALSATGAGSQELEETDRRRRETRGMAAHATVSAQTRYHNITIKDGGLTITGNGNTLTSEETYLVLVVLLIWQYGLETVAPDDGE